MAYEGPGPDLAWGGQFVGPSPARREEIRLGAMARQREAARMPFKIPLPEIGQYYPQRGVTPGMGQIGVPIPGLGGVPSQGSVPYPGGAFPVIPVLLGAAAGLGSYAAGESIAGVLGTGIGAGVSAYQGAGNGGMPTSSGVGIQVGGPGVPEPPKHMVMRTWETTVYSNTYGYMKCYFFALIDGRVMMWHSKADYWRIWRPKKHIILPRGKTTLSQAVKAQRYLDRLWRTVAKRTKALKMA